MTRADLADRLTAATWYRVPDDVRARHRQAIVAAASVATPASADAATSTGRLSGVSWRLRRGVVAAAGVLVLAVPGVGWAAQGALPGSPLYGVKRATEPVLSLVDGRIRAEHRVEELEQLLAAKADDAQLEHAAANAEGAVQSLSPQDPLAGRLARAQAVLTARVGDELPGDAGQGGDHAGEDHGTTGADHASTEAGDHADDHAPVGDTSHGNDGEATSSHGRDATSDTAKSDRGDRGATDHGRAADDRGDDHAVEPDQSRSTADDTSGDTADDTSGHADGGAATTQDETGDETTSDKTTTDGTTTDGDTTDGDTSGGESADRGDGDATDADTGTDGGTTREDTGVPAVSKGSDDLQRGSADDATQDR